MTDWGPTNNDEDSGVPMPGHYIRIWNGIQAGKASGEVPPELATVNAVAYLADIAGMAMAIARNKSNDPLARAMALDVARKAAMDQVRFGDENDRLA